MDADFDALAKSKNEYNSSDKENELVVELFNVWSKIDAYDLLAWVGVWVTNGIGTKKKNRKNRSEERL